MKTNLIAVEIMKHLCNCHNHGYSQGSNRWGNNEIEKIYIDGEYYAIAGGDRDCSSAIITAWSTALGISLPCTYTGNMKEGFLSTGLFAWFPMSSGFIAEPGDIYLNIQHHTAMCISDIPDMLGEFNINEYGEIIGGQEGDQTGQESRIRTYYDFPWDGILHYKGGENDMTPGEFFNYDIPKANESGKTIPVWQFFTWVLEHVTSIYETVNKINHKIGCDEEVKALLNDIQTELASSNTAATKVKNIKSKINAKKTLIDSL